MNKIKIEINGIVYQATLEDNNVAKELLNRLPLTITMNELNGNEKYYYFDVPFPSSPTRIGKINKGDLMLYEENCLVLFYETFATFYTYTKIGSIDHPENLTNVVGNDNILVHISK